MNVLQIRLFGTFELKYAGLTLTNIGSSKAQELICYVLLHRHRSYLREALAEWLWGENPNIQNKKLMRQTLWEIQSTLKAQAQTAELHLLSVSPNWIQLSPELAYELDVAEFENSFLAAKGIPVAELSGKQIEALQKAEALYGGDLLEGWYWDWCAADRERYRDQYLTILEKLVLWAEINHQYEAGLAYGTRILECDRALESAHQYLMRLYYRSGSRVKALRQFERCATILKEELGVKPSQQTLRLYEQIKADELEEAAPVNARPTVTLLPKLADSRIGSLSQPSLQ